MYRFFLNEKIYDKPWSPSSPSSPRSPITPLWPFSAIKNPLKNSFKINVISATTAKRRNEINRTVSPNFPLNPAGPIDPIEPLSPNITKMMCC